MEYALENRKKRRLAAKRHTLSINGKTYRIFNINEYGVGFLVDTPQDIQIGTTIEPVLLVSDRPIRMTGVARHVSHFRDPGDRLYFQKGWVCGTEFTTQQDPEGWELFKSYLDETGDEETR